MGSASVGVASSAPPEIVWGVLTDFSHWPDWSGYKSAQLDGPLASGAKLLLGASLGVNAVFTILSVDPGRTLTLRQEGRTAREHAYSVTAAPAGGSRITQAITLGGFAGLVARIAMPLVMWLFVRPILKRLAAQSERLAGGPDRAAEGGRAGDLPAPALDEAVWGQAAPAVSPASGARPRVIAAVLLVGALVAGGVVFTQLRNTPTLPTYHEGKVLVSEALSNAQGPFEPGEDAITQVRYVPGGFQVLMKAPNRNTRFGQSGGLGTRNLRVEADITFATPTPAGTRSLPYAGVICRSYQSRSDQGRYLFGIDAGGHAFIVRYRTLDSSDLKELARSGPSATIRQTTPNRIQADCLQVNGTSVALVLRVNGTQLLQTIDNDPGLLGILEGGWGIETVSGSEAGFAAIFANLRVTEMLAGS